MIQATPVVSLSNSEALPITVKDSLFFKYDLEVNEEHPDLSELLVLLNVSKRKNLTVFIGNENYPAQKNDDYDYAAGDLSQDKLNKVSVK